MKPLLIIKTIFRFETILAEIKNASSVWCHNVFIEEPINVTVDILTSI